jgi:DNA-binding NarL/FixJ family response regulator
VTTTVLVAAGARADSEAAATVRLTTNRHGGKLVSVPGDRTVARFDSAVAAAHAAIDAQQRAMLNVGLAVGEPERGDSVPHAALARASALADFAAPGEILGDVVVRVLLEGSDIETSPKGELDVGGGSGAIEVVAVVVSGPPERRRLRVIIADDAALIRAGLVRLLVDEGFEVVADVADATTLLAAVDASPPDLVITDVRMPPDGTDDGLRAATVIRERHPGVAVLVLSQYVEASSAAALLDARVAGVGYLLKERVGDLDAFVATCHEVAAGGRAVDPAVGEQLLHSRKRDAGLSRLTDREHEVLTLMAQGRSNTAICSELAVSSKTLETHVHAIFQKLDLPASPDEHRRVAAVIRYLDATTRRTE